MCAEQVAEQLPDFDMDAYIAGGCSSQGKDDGKGAHAAGPKAKDKGKGKAKGKGLTCPLCGRGGFKGRAGLAIHESCEIGRGPPIG